MTPERMKELRVDMTPGPWKVAPDGRRVFACDERETIICEVSGCAQNAATAAEVQLIAALPECLDTIERFRKALIQTYMDTDVCPICDCHNHARTPECPLADADKP